MRKLSQQGRNSLGSSSSSGNSGGTGIINGSEGKRLLSFENIRGKDGNGIEWLYSFDIHCNSYFIYFIISNVILLLLTPIMYHESSTFSLILGNSVYLIAIIMYFYITFLGYQGYVLNLFVLFCLGCNVLDCVIFLCVCLLLFFIFVVALPTTSNTEILLYPLPIVLILYIISLLTHFSVTHRLLRWHYGYGA